MAMLKAKSRLISRFGVAGLCTNQPPLVQSRPLDAIPGPRGWPFVGNIPDLAKNRSKAGKDNYFYKLHEQYGKIFKLNFFGSPLVSVADPGAAAKVFRAEGKLPSRGEVFEKNMMWIHDKNNLPYPMFASGGEPWKETRSNTSKQVIPRRVAELTTGTSEIADNLFNYLCAKRSADGYVNRMEEVLMKWAFQGAAYFAFNERLNTFEYNEENQKFQDAAIAMIECLSKVSNALPLYKLFPTKPYKEYVNSVKQVYSRGKVIMDRKYNEILKGLEDGTFDESKAVGLVEHWLVEGKLSKEVALMLSCDMLAVGIDTTSNTASFMLHEVAKHPKVQEELHKEVTSVLGDRTTPTFDDLQKLTLVRNCVKETFRLYLAIPAIPRVIRTELDILGYKLPAGTSVLVNTGFMSSDAAYFQAPNSFQPDRWKRDSDTVDPFLSLPFGFGPRSCYGRRFAELELYLLLSKLMQKFTISTDQMKLKTLMATIQKPAEPVRIKITERHR